MEEQLEADAVGYRSQDEVDDAVDALTDDDIVRLIARGNAAALGTDLSGEDLFAQAVERLLSGRRPWKADVEFEAHATMVMKSIGSNRRRAMKKAPSADLELLDARRDFANETGLEERIGSAQRVNELLKAVEGLFEEDQTGFALFLARADGLPVDEVCEFAGIGRDQYDTVYKRVQRKLGKALASGAIR